MLVLIKYVVKGCLLPYSSAKALIGRLKGRELRYIMKWGAQTDIKLLPTMCMDNYIILLF